jgi:hypothetical protein
MLAVPFKANAKCRHHIPKQKRRLMNWAAYEASLRQRGDLTVWFREAIAAWRAEPRTNRGGQPWYSPLAILTALTLRAVFHLALRQTEGLIGSLIRLLGLDLPMPDRTALSRRGETLVVPRPRSGSGAEPVHLLVDSTGLKLCGAGEWLIEKPPFSHSRTQSRRFCVNTSSTFMPSVAPIRAKLNTISPISARSRNPTGVVISMRSISARASSGANTGVLPAFTTCAGPRTDPAGFVGTTWPVTSQSNR